MAGQLGIPTIPPHYITHNKLSRIPKCIAAFSVETDKTDKGGDTWAWGAWAIASLDPKGLEATKVTYSRTYDPNSLWQDLTDAAIKVGKIVVISANLTADVQLSGAIPWLVSNGWLMDRLNIRDDSFSGAFHLGKARIVLADLKAWIPGGLAKIASLSGQMLSDSARGVLDPDMTTSAAERKCRAVIYAAVELAEWTRDADRGNWKPSGAGQAWATWRHNHYTNNVLAHGRPGLLEIEREAAGTGRAEAWKWGSFKGRQLVEWDLPLAYAAIAGEFELPAAYSGTMDGASLRLMTHPPKGRRFLLHAQVRQTEPILGVRIDDRWVWPTGELIGWWWDYEVAEAVAAGAEVRVLECHTYAASMCLADWAAWTLDYLSADNRDATPVRYAAVKHEARALIGRFGVRYDVWRPDGAAIKPGYYSALSHDYEADLTLPLLVLGSKQYVSSEKAWGRDAIPQIMSAIMSQCRIQLWQLVKTAGEEEVAYMDTDSLIVTPTGSDRLEGLVATGGGWGIRIKHDYWGAEILGPRQMITDRDRKVSGIAKTATRTSARSFSGTVGQGIGGAFGQGLPTTVSFSAREWKLEDVDRRRRHLEEGKTAPFEAAVTNGKTHLL